MLMNVFGKLSAEPNLSGLCRSAKKVHADEPFRQAERRAKLA